ncbi:MAG: hypothetical protein PUD16_10055 [bacterium]|nr:hypothetical protein [bacterium]
MYRLLIVSANQNTRDMIAAMEGWEKLGFRAPRICCSPEEAIESLGRHHADAIALDQTPDFDQLLSYLDQYHPNKPLFELADSPEKQRLILQELGGLLNRLNADDSNETYDAAYRLQQQRERWLRKVIGGMVATEAEMCRQQRLYRCRECLTVPCVLARLELPQEDSFLSERWHYGSERLETALRNFFGYEHDHMLMHVAVISQEEVRVLFYPTCSEGISENTAFDYVQETLEQIDHYLGLRMKVLEVRRVPGLLAFAAENA